MSVMQSVGLFIDDLERLDVSVCFKQSAIISLVLLCICESWSFAVREGRGFGV